MSVKIIMEIQVLVCFYIADMSNMTDGLKNRVRMSRPAKSVQYSSDSKLPAQMFLNYIYSIFNTKRVKT